MNIKNIFKSEYGDSKNFMTPDIISYGGFNKLVYEISSGKGFDKETIYGVTVLEIGDKPTKRPDLNGCFMTMKDAESHIRINIKNIL